ncbi:MAG: hypothetical protein JZU65_00050 [Chlorobium sp.]|jgi:hypothetical protein|nr:hypothetical protein [Chlorobium sp.]
MSDDRGKWSDTKKWGMGILASVIVAAAGLFLIKPVHDIFFPPEVPLALQQELSKFREVLSQPPRTNRQPSGKYPDVNESSKFAKWNEPNKFSVNRIVTLAEMNPMSVVRALIPLLSDSDGVVVEGALLSLRDILAACRPCDRQTC